MSKLSSFITSRYSFIIFFVVILVISIFTIVNLLTNKIIYQNSNEFGTVYLRGNIKLRCITTDLNLPIIQSCYNPLNKEEIIVPYIKEMLSIPENIIPKKIDRILVLGLGGGSIVKNIASKLPNTLIDVVEINEIMKEVAEKFFECCDNKNVKIYIKDALEFVINAHRRYDIIYIDTYLGSYIPKGLVTDYFVKHLSFILNPKGVVVINFANLGSSHDALIELYDKYFTKFCTKNAGLTNLVAYYVYK